MVEFVIAGVDIGVEAGVDIFVIFVVFVVFVLLVVALFAAGSQAIPKAPNANNPVKAITFFIFLILLSSSKIIQIFIPNCVKTQPCPNLIIFWNIGQYK